MIWPAVSPPTVWLMSMLPPLATGCGGEQPDVVDRGAGGVDRADALEAQRVVAGDGGDQIGLGCIAVPVLLIVVDQGAVPIDLEAAAARGRPVGMVELELHDLAGGEAGDRLADVHVAAARRPARSRTGGRCRSSAPRRVDRAECP